jgi:hypothetical protein
VPSREPRKEDFRLTMHRYIAANTGARSAHRNARVTCAHCGRKVDRQMRGQRYCSKHCRQKGNYAEKVARGDFSTPYTAPPTTPRKSARNINALQGAKTRSSTFANPPLNIVGGGSFRWPNTPALDAKTREAIRLCEIGQFASGLTGIESGGARRKHRRRDGR